MLKKIVSMGKRSVALSIILLMAFLVKTSSGNDCCRQYGGVDCTDWDDIGMVECPESSETTCPISQRSCSTGTYCYTNVTCNYQEATCKANCSWPDIVRQQPDCEATSEVAIEWLEWQITGNCIGSGPCFCNGCGPIAFQLVEEKPCS